MINRKDYSDIFQFYFIEGFSIKEISNLFFQSENNINQKIHRIRHLVNNRKKIKKNDKR